MEPMSRDETVPTPHKAQTGEEEEGAHELDGEGSEGGAQLQDDERCCQGSVGARRRGGNLGRESSPSNKCPPPSQS